MYRNVQGFALVLIFIYLLLIHMECNTQIVELIEDRVVDLFF